MKKTFITAITLAAALSLSACGDKSQNKDDVKKEVEITTEATTLSKEQNAPEIIDAFEGVEPRLANSSYPRKLSFELKTTESPFRKYMTYNSTIKTADTEKIIIEVTANTEELGDFLKDNNFEFDSDTKVYEISLDEIEYFTTSLMNEKQLSDDNVQTICESLCNIFSFYDLPAESVKYIYALIPPEGSIFYKDYECINNSVNFLDDDIEKELITNTPPTSIYAVIQIEDVVAIYPTNLTFSEGKMEERIVWGTSIMNPNNDNNMQSDNFYDVDSAKEFMQEKISELEKEYSFTAKEIDLTK